MSETMRTVAELEREIAAQKEAFDRAEKTWQGGDARQALLADALKRQGELVIRLERELERARDAKAVAA